MHRAILIAWLPSVLALLAGMAALWLVMRVSGARLRPARLLSLHRCESGSVQTLSFVLTLPVFVMLLLFIVQMAELMVGVGIVHYAAFAGARAASVWVPATTVYEPANTFEPESLSEANWKYPRWILTEMDLRQFAYERQFKYRKIGLAASIALAPLGPSRDLEEPSQSSRGTEILKRVYASMVPRAARYPGTPRLIQKKLDYSLRNTRIGVTGVDRQGAQGPTYNPYPGYFTMERNPTTGALTEVWVPWKPHEIGWEDPILVFVEHKLALLPGPGRLLATKLLPADGTRDQVSPLIEGRNTDRENYRVNDTLVRAYKTKLTAAVTISNEGLKSVMPYVQATD
jgi:hypothetical protein